MPTLIVLMLLLLLTGCMSSGNNAVMDQDRLAKITVDVSTKDDVKRLLGQPNTIMRRSGQYPVWTGLPPGPALPHNSEVWSYMHMSMDVDGATFIPIVGLFAGGATSHVDTFTVVFDEHGIARSLSSGQSQARSGMGAHNDPAPVRPMKGGR